MLFWETKLLLIEKLSFWHKNENAYDQIHIPCDFIKKLKMLQGFLCFTLIQWLHGISKIVPYSSADYCIHRSLFDKSMKFGIVLDISWDISYDAKLNRSKICYFGIKQ